MDTIFFLLATLIMVSLSMSKNQGLSVHLPVESLGSRQERNDIVTITVAEDGTYAWNTVSIATTELAKVVIQTTPEP